MFEKIRQFVRRTLDTGSAEGTPVPSRPAEPHAAPTPNPPNPTGVRPATLHDIEFLVSVIEDGARDRHFHPSNADPAYRSVLRGNLELAIEKDAWEMTPGVVHGASLWVVETGGAPVGFILATETGPGSGDTSHEILMMGINRAARGRGLGGALLNTYIHGSPAGVTITGRCYPASDRMLGMLRRRGFVERQITPSGIRHMELPPRPE